MGIAALRALVRDINAAWYGVAVTVTPPGGPTVAAKGVWTMPVAEDMPIGRDFQRREPRRVLALRVSEVGSSVPRGTVIVGAEHGAASRDWKVDGLESQDAELIRVVLVPVI